MVGRLGVDPAVPVEDLLQVPLGGVQVAGAAGAEGQADEGEDPARREPVLDGRALGALVQLRGPRRTRRVEQGDPAQPGQLVADLGPQPELLGHPQPGAVQPAAPA